MQTKEELLFEECSKEDVDYNVVKQIVDKGVDINYQNKHGTAILHHVIENGHFEVLKLFLKNGANINIKDCFGDNILIYACDYNNFKLVKFLVKNGADINNVNNSNETIFNYLRQIIKEIESNLSSIESEYDNFEDDEDYIYLEEELNKYLKILDFLEKYKNY